MSVMYSMQPFGEVHVQPAEILYKLPSYHGNNIEASSSNPTTQSSSSNNDKSADLKAYIKKIVDGTSQLSISMKKFVEEQKKVSTAQTVSVAPFFESAASNKQLTVELDEGFSRASVQFHYKLARYQPLLNKKIEVFAGPKYHDVMKVFHEMSAKRNNSIHIRDVTTDGIYVETTSADGQKVTIKSSVPSLLLIGEALGIYSYRDYHLAGSGELLAEIDDALHGRISISDLIREVNSHLGPNDLLTKSNCVSLVDVVFYAVARQTSLLPNNTEMFVKRISEALSNA